jgi:divalent metal cation (Fe/Co/Zn/Cd) transporter
MTEQLQQTDIVKKVGGVLMFIPFIGIPVILASFGIKIAGFIINAAGSVLGQAATVLSGACCSTQNCSKP